MPKPNEGNFGGKLVLGLFAAYAIYQVQQCSAPKQQPFYIQQPQIPASSAPSLNTLNKQLPPELRMTGHQGGVTCTQGIDDISGQLVTKCLPN